MWLMERGQCMGRGLLKYRGVKVLRRVGANGGTGLKVYSGGTGLKVYPGRDERVEE